MKERVGVVSRTVHWKVRDASKDGTGNGVPGMPPVVQEVVNFRLDGSALTVCTIVTFWKVELPFVGAVRSDWPVGTREKLTMLGNIPSQVEKSPSTVYASGSIRAPAGTVSAEVLVKVVSPLAS